MAIRRFTRSHIEIVNNWYGSLLLSTSCWCPAVSWGPSDNLTGLWRASFRSIRAPQRCSYASSRTARWSRHPGEGHCTAGCSTCPKANILPLHLSHLSLPLPRLPRLPLHLQPPRNGRSEPFRAWTGARPGPGETSWTWRDERSKQRLKLTKTSNKALDHNDCG